MHDIVQTALQNGGSASTAKIRARIEEETGEVVSRCTVYRALHREGFAAKRRRPGPAIMDHHKEVRQVWSLLHRDDAFDTTVFIDEANFQLHRNSQVIWCRANEAPPRIGMPHTSPSISVLAGVSSVCTTPLVIGKVSRGMQSDLSRASATTSSQSPTLSSPVSIVTCWIMPLATRHSLPEPGLTRKAFSCSSSRLLSRLTAPRKLTVPHEGPR